MPADCGVVILMVENLLKFGWELCINLFSDLAESALLNIAIIWGLAYLLAVAVTLKVDAMFVVFAAIMGPS